MFFLMKSLKECNQNIRIIMKISKSFVKALMKSSKKCPSKVSVNCETEALSTNLKSAFV